jgi:MFS family permease
MREGAGESGSSSARYEWQAVLLLSIGFGLVGLDRFIILPLFPVLATDLGLDYQDLGDVAAVLALSWGVCAVVVGRVSDRLGRRAVLIPAVVSFSLLAGMTGLVTGLTGLLLSRALMGATEGAFTPVSIAATIEASKPTRRGFNLGLQQQLYAILGLGFGPILATQLLLLVPSWRWVFLIVCLPGFLLAAFLARVLRNTQGTMSVRPSSRSAGEAPRWRDVFKHRNIVINMLGMCFMLTSLTVVTSMVPNYMTDHLHLNLQTMGAVMSAIGFGGFVGQLILPGLSDRIGRKPVVLACYAGTLVALVALTRVGAEPVLLFVLLFCASAFNNSMICLNVGPLTCEAVDSRLTSTATGLVVGTGEIFGGGVAPALAGWVAKHFGIENTFSLATGALALGLMVSLALVETAPAPATQCS